MDVNYSRWMSKDPDAELDEIADEPRRFNLPQPARSVVAASAFLALVALGGGAYVRSISTAEVSAEQAETVQTPAAEESSGPGAAGVEDSTWEDSTPEDSTSEGSASDDSAADERPERLGPPPMDRRELHVRSGVRPGEPLADGERLPPPMPRP